MCNMMTIANIAVRNIGKLVSPSSSHHKEKAVSFSFYYMRIWMLAELIVLIISQYM